MMTCKSISQLLEEPSPATKKKKRRTLASSTFWPYGALSRIVVNAPGMSFLFYFF